MKLLILHQFTNHNYLIETLCKKLNSNNIETDSFNITTWEFVSSSRKLPLGVKILKFFLFDFRLRLFIVKYFPFFLARLFRRYDVVDIHFFGSLYYATLDTLNRLRKKIKFTIWGSDFYRASVATREQQREYYEMSVSIQIGTAQMKADFVGYFKDFEDKISLAHFGITKFQDIEEVRFNETHNFTKLHLGVPNDKLIVTCGYNASQGQQHLLILEAIEKLDKALKSKIFLLLPMTYGADLTYLGAIESKLNAMGVAYLTLSEELTAADVCRVRLATDIMINIQITDAFSASIQEHLFAQNVVIVGEWLPYDKLKEYNVIYSKTSLENLSITLENSITNYTSLKQQILDNKEKMRQISSWDVVIKDWVRMYATLN